MISWPRPPPHCSASFQNSAVPGYRYLLWHKKALSKRNKTMRLLSKESKTGQQTAATVRPTTWTFWRVFNNQSISTLSSPWSRGLQDLSVPGRLIMIHRALVVIFHSTQHLNEKREGSGSVLVTNGSGCGSGRPKNIRIQRDPDAEPDPEHWLRVDKQQEAVPDRLLSGGFH